MAQKNINKNFKNTLRDLMNERGLNQMQLANLVGIRQSQVSNLLQGKSMPNYWTLKDLAEKLEICVSNFF